MLWIEKAQKSWGLSFNGVRSSVMSGGFRLARSDFKLLYMNALQFLFLLLRVAHDATKPPLGASMCS